MTKKKMNIKDFSEQDFAGFSPTQWEKYLKSIEAPLYGRQIHPRKYDAILEKQTTTIWDLMFEGDSPFKAVITRSLRVLTQKQRLVIEKCFFEGLTERTIAEEMKTAPGAVHDLKVRALNRIKTYLEENTSSQPVVRGQKIFEPENSLFEDDELNEVYWSQVNR